jgi:hypothetical protein
MEDVKKEDLDLTEATTDVTIEQLFQPQRLENESYDQYRERRFVANYKSKMITKGRMFWDSKIQKTYRKDQVNPLGV